MRRPISRLMEDSDTESFVVLLRRNITVVVSVEVQLQLVTVKRKRIRFYHYKETL